MKVILSVPDERFFQKRFVHTKLDIYDCNTVTNPKDELV